MRRLLVLFMMLPCVVALAQPCPGLKPVTKPINYVTVRGCLEVNSACRWYWLSVVKVKDVGWVSDDTYVVEYVSEMTHCSSRVRYVDSSNIHLTEPPSVDGEPLDLVEQREWRWTSPKAERLEKTDTLTVTWSMRLKFKFRRRPDTLISVLAAVR